MNDSDATNSPANTPTLHDDFRVKISRFLGEYVADQRVDAGYIDQRYDMLWQSIEQLITVGGKRIRPYLVAASYEAFAAQQFPEKYMTVAVAQELLHLAMLIHDDIIDRDDTRYGVKNISGQYYDNYEEYLHDSDQQRHFASSAAILAGDVLLSQAHVLTAQASVDATVMTRLQQIIGMSVFEAVGGELLDTEATFTPIGEDHSLRVSRFKTASYTFIAPLKIGALLAGASPIDLDSLEQIGAVLGIGYQMRDDILGVFGDTSTTGKSAIGDIREGKRTYLIDQFELLATPEQQAQFSELFGDQSLTADQLDVVKQLFRDSGALDATESAIDQYAQAARGDMTSLDLNTDWSQSLLNLIDRCMNRTV